MNTYLVRLVSRDTDDVLRILVRSKDQDGMQEFVESIADLGISNPVVASIHQLRTARPAATAERELTVTGR